MSYFILVFFFAFPAIYTILIGANLYSGFRQMYFIYPAIVLFSAIGIYQWYEVLKLNSKKGFLLLFIGLCIWPSTFIFKNFSPDYVYFNIFAGGNKNAFGTYEYDYYWHHLKEATNWLDQNVQDTEAPAKIAANFDLSCYHNMDERFDFTYIHFMERAKIDYDYAVLEVNYIHPYQLEHETWKPTSIVFEKKHRGNPSFQIIKSRGNEAFIAHQYYRSSQYELAQRYFTTALENDPNDLNLRAYLAKCYLINKEWVDFNRVIQEGYILNPYYEPLLILEAEMFHRKQEYGKAVNVLKKLISENPRYIYAVELLLDCYHKLGQKDKENYIKNKYKSIKSLEL